MSVNQRSFLLSGSYFTSGRLYILVSSRARSRVLEVCGCGGEGEAEMGVSRIIRVEPSKTDL